MILHIRGWETRDQLVQRWILSSAFCWDWDPVIFPFPFIKKRIVGKKKKRIIKQLGDKAEEMLNIHFFIMFLYYILEIQ